MLSSSLYQQDYSSAQRISYGTSAEIAILWNCSRDLSNYMLNVGWGRRQRQTLIYWKMSMVDIWWPRITSRQSFLTLLLNIISVSFIFLFDSTHLTTFICLNTAHPGESQASGESASGDQVLELERKSEKKFTRLQKLMRKIHKVWWGRKFSQELDRLYECGSLM